MRSVLLIILGCLPLAVLTVLNLSGPALDGELATVGQLRQDAEQAFGRARSALAEARPAEADLIDGDLLSGGSAAAESAEGERPRWLRAWRIEVGLIKAEKLAAGVDLDSRQQARKMFISLKEQSAEPPLPGSDALSALLDKRIETLTEQIGGQRSEVQSEAERKRLTEEATRLLADARAAFTAKKYAQCVSLCDRLGDIQSRGVNAADVGKLAELRKRAATRDRFVKEDTRLSALIGPSKGLNETQLDERLTELRDAVDAWKNNADVTLLSNEQRARLHELAAAIGRRCRELEAELTALRRKTTLAELERNPGKDFFIRLARAERVLDEYPSEDVKRRLGALVRQWIGESLGVKKTDEPDWMRHAQSKRNKTIRGYFKPIEDGAGGRPAGWRVSDTRESAEGIIWRLNQLKGPPRKPPARQCVDDYNAARERLLAKPRDKSLWTGFSSGCEDIERRWESAQDEFGSVEDLSFKAEARFARQVLDDDVWKRFTKLLGEPKR